MCEIVAAAWPEPRPLMGLLERAMQVERFGIDGFGWGVAWLDDVDRGAGSRVRGYRSVRSLADDADGRRRLGPVTSQRFVIHLRRPSLLSTIDLADTQPFVADAGRFALAHNGRFDRHESFRARHADRLSGRADSEVGFRVFERLVGDGAPARSALRRTLHDLGGYGNLVYLGADGELVALGDHHLNPFWRFELDDGVVASTACHSEDDSVFRLVFGDASSPLPVTRDGLSVAGASTATSPSTTT
ncbi:MAG: class II glutamine amidotransferase [Acidimicrobiales bacterium]